MSGSYLGRKGSRARKGRDMKRRQLLRKKFGMTREQAKSMSKEIDARHYGETLGDEEAADDRERAHALGLDWKGS